MQCPHFDVGECRSCPLMGVPYARQLADKQAAVLAALADAVDADTVVGALDNNVGDAGAIEALGQELADLDVFCEVISVLLVGVPAGAPLGSDTQPEAVRLDLLAHY